MRVGILTYSCADNVGAVLQCYALKAYIESRGINAEVINYCPYYLTDSYGYFHNPVAFMRRHGIYRTLTRIRYEICNFNTNYKKTKKFESFRKKYLEIGPQTYREKQELEGIEEYFDAIVVGSDQIWRPISKREGVDDAFLLTFCKNTRTKKISYAASAGKVPPVSKQRDYLPLKDFYALSVRESDLREILGQILNKKIEHVLDPVFLNNKNVYDSLLVNCYKNNRKEFSKFPFLFVYILEQNEDLIKFVNFFSREKYQNKIKVYYYSRKKITGFFKEGEPERITDLGPLDFLYFIKKSDTVITNSFHGTAFSIIYQKNFFTLPHKETGSRITSMVKELGLDRRIIGNECLWNDNIKWGEIENRLKQSIERSQIFLERSLHGKYE